MRKKQVFNKWKMLIIILIIAFLGLFLTPTGWAKPVRNYFWQALRPVGISLRVTIGRSLPFVKEAFQLGKIIKQNSNLVSENLALQSRLATTSEMSYENEVLKKELGFMKSTDSAKTIPAAIIGQSNGYLKSVVIDKGQNIGLVGGEAVISQGFLVGTITLVRENNAEVTLLSDFNSLIPAVLQNSRGTGILHGGLQGLTVEDIPLNIGIQKDENVVTSGLGGDIPSGISIGKVTNVISKGSEIFQKVTVASPVDFSNLEVLFIVKKNE